MCAGMLHLGVLGKTVQGCAAVLLQLLLQMEKTPVKSIQHLWQYIA
jgi:hypothetical protein